MPDIAPPAGKYFTGKPCKRGHVAFRTRSDRKCVACAKEDDQRRQRLDPSKGRERSARHWQKNRARISAKYALKYKNNREEMLAQRAAYKAANLPRHAAHEQRRRARRVEADGDGVSAVQWLDILHESSGLCAYCATKAPLTMEHVDAIALGGRHEVDNIAAVCARCNGSKNKNPLVLWLALRANRTNETRVKFWAS